MHCAQRTLPPGHLGASPVWAKQAGGGVEEWLECNTPCTVGASGVKGIEDTRQMQRKCIRLAETVTGA